mmetsp:Transcript_80997/g.121763  ORF Transcript_80997/g.121763 Transcript_80997/m.121763 type:complete len:89 (-) Transcript_80997:264-530(-)
MPGTATAHPAAFSRDPKSNLLNCDRSTRCSRTGFLHLISRCPILVEAHASGLEATSSEMCLSKKGRAFWILRWMAAGRNEGSEETTMM